MNGETDLSTLLSNIHPQLQKEVFVFTCISRDQPLDLHTMEPFGIFQEKEGTTLILVQKIADKHVFSYEGTFSCITLQIHSSLHAVGLTAAVSRALAQNDIPANIIAAYHHDHIFIPQEKALEALTILENISRKP